MKKKIKNVLIVMVIIFIPIYPFLLSPLINNIGLYIFSRQLFDAALPQGTSIVEKHSICGKLNGNGNGMDYLAVILVKSDLSAEELKNSISCIDFKSGKGKPEGVSIEVNKQYGAVLKSEFLEHGSIEFSTSKEAKDFSSFYYILIFSNGITNAFDIRGH